MNLLGHSSFSGLRCYYAESRRSSGLNVLPPKSLPRSYNFNREVSCSNSRRFVVSCHLVPRRLEGPYSGKKLLSLPVPVPRQKLEFVRTLLLDNYDSYTYNIYQELAIINGVPPVVIKNDEWTWRDMYRYLYEEKAFDNIVISPGPGSPSCPNDIGICLHILLECGDIPILGVCLGHQALGYVHGAKVVHASEPVHGRLSELEHNGCKLFQGIPSGRNSGFKVVRYHSLMIDSESVPEELIPISWTESADTLPFFEGEKSVFTLDALEVETGQKASCHSLGKKFGNGSLWPQNYSGKGRQRKALMGIMHSTRPHYGVQFHPESIATSHGAKIFKNFRDITEDYWLRFKASIIHERNASYAACMQVPEAAQQVNVVPRSRPKINRADNLPSLEASRCESLMLEADKRSGFGMFNFVNLSHASRDIKLLRLRWRKLDQLASQIGGARNIFRKLFGRHKADNSFWLDSSSTEKQRARFSYMGAKGGELWKQLTFHLSGRSDLTSKRGGYLSIEDAEGSTKIKFLEHGFLDFLNEELSSFRYEEEDFEGLPFDFHGGYVGYIGYSLKVECGAETNSHKSRTPDASFFFVDNLLVIDHHNDDVYIMSIQEGCTTTTTWLDDTVQKLLRLKTSSTKLKEQTSRDTSILPRQPGFVAEKSREQYIEDIEKCMEYIKDGESYELCLTTQIRKEIGEMDRLGLYLKLREKNPAPYAAWLNFSKQSLCICCSSPERFLRLGRDGTLEAKPIKGTIARGATTGEDKELKLKLQYSEKDQAENLMIVDLLRNDLGRICEPGSVHVPRLMNIESYATVHTMVSTIRGKKKSNISPVECVRAAFPGGSMTGAPKLRSMELLDSIESCSRGIYSGCIGFFSYNQTFDLNIVIRTVVLHEGEASIGAGGAIVALSNPEDEYEEMILKTRAPATAVLEFL